MHHAFGAYESSRKNLQAYEAGIIDYPEFMRRDIGLWGTRSIVEIKTILQKFTLSKGVLDVCDILRQRGYQLAILSAGIDIGSGVLQSHISKIIMLDVKILGALHKKSWPCPEAQRQGHKELPKDRSPKFKTQGKAVTSD